MRNIRNLIKKNAIALIFLFLNTLHCSTKYVIQEKLSNDYLLLVDYSDFIHDVGWRGFQTRIFSENKVIDSKYFSKQDYLIFKLSAEYKYISLMIMDTHTIPFQGMKIKSTQADKLQGDELQSKYISNPIKIEEGKNRLVYVKLKKGKNILDTPGYEKILGIIFFPILWPAGYFPTKDYERINLEVRFDSTPIQGRYKNIARIQYR